MTSPNTIIADLQVENDALRRQRDALLVALERLANKADELCRWDRRFDDVLDAADAAIASVKGDKTCIECKSLSPSTPEECQRCEEDTPAFTEVVISMMKGGAKC